MKISPCAFNGKKEPIRSSIFHGSGLAVLTRMSGAALLSERKHDGPLFNLSKCTLPE